MNLLASINRPHLLQKMANTEFDLLVIGGGITGAGIALDAASRGLKTALIEKKDFATGTSSRSTKLIHGGLRYLKQLEVGLVRESGSERAIVHKLAPHLVVPEKMVLPLIKGGTYGKIATSIGLKVYDFVAGVGGKDRRKMLNKKQTLELEPLLNPETLLGSGYYAEYRTDDARLTIENIKTATRNNAMVCNYLEALSFIEEEGKVVGAQVKDHLQDEIFPIKAKAVVSATGPWVDDLRKKNGHLEGKRLHLTKGVHIVVPYEKLPLKQSMYFDVPDGRMIFAIPRGKITYVGTTDTDYNKSLDDIRATNDDVRYILNAVNNTFPDIELTSNDIQSSWAGLRPLIHQPGKSASELSRKDEIFVAPNDLVSIAGGKLTGYRKMAERVVDLVLEKFFDKSIPTTTDHIPLTQDPFRNYEEVRFYLKDMKKLAEQKGLSEIDLANLIHLYGKQGGVILEKMYQSTNPIESLVLAQLDYSLEHEMVHTLTDFFVRRTGMLYFDIETVHKTRLAATDYMLLKSRCRVEDLKTFNNELDKEIERATAFEIVKQKMTA